MDFLKINNDIYSSYAEKMNSYRGNPSKNNNLPAVTTKIPEIKDTFIRGKASEDGKFSSFEFGKNVVKGVGLFAVDIVKNVFKHPLLSLGSIAVFGALASAPLGLSFLAGIGIASVAVGGVLLGIKAANCAVNDKWDDLEKTGTQLGKLLPAGLISGFAAMKGISMLSKASDAGQKASLLQSVRKAVELDVNIAGSFIKNVVATTFNGVKSVVKNPTTFFKKEVWKEAWAFKKNIKTDYQEIVKGLNKNLFSAKEKNFLHKDAKVFDWTYKNFKETLPITVKELGDT